MYSTKLKLSAPFLSPPRQAINYRERGHTDVTLHAVHTKQTLWIARSWLSADPSWLIPQACVVPSHLCKNNKNQVSCPCAAVTQSLPYMRPHLSPVHVDLPSKRAYHQSRPRISLSSPPANTWRESRVTTVVATVATSRRLRPPGCMHLNCVSGTSVSGVYGALERKQSRLQALTVARRIDTVGEERACARACVNKAEKSATTPWCLVVRPFTIGLPTMAIGML